MEHWSLVYQGPEWEAFQAAARAIDDVAFVQTTEKVVADEAAVKGSAPAIVLLKDEEEKLLQYGEKRKLWLLLRKIVCWFRPQTEQ